MAVYLDEASHEKPIRHPLRFLWCNPSLQ